MSDKTIKTRLDKWLWAARFFKTRSLATQAVQGGKVHLGGIRVKPAKELNVGDVLSIKKDELVFLVTVVALSNYRRPASEARLLYEETDQSLKDREEKMSMNKLIRAPGVSPSKRPGKRDRRKIREFIRKD